jgi:hypothetical protein
MTRKKKGKVGSSFDRFLAEQGILEECEEQAIKQISPIRSKKPCRRSVSPRRPWPFACEPAVERSTVCSIQQTRASHCTLFNALLRPSAANSTWNWIEVAASTPSRA